MPKQELKDTLSVRRLIETNQANLKDQVVSINRVTKVVKGGKNLSFSALVVVGDQGGHAGFGMGKAREVPMAIRKAIEQAKKNMVKLNLKGSTIPHQVVGYYGSGQVLLKPAPEGTGVIAGGPVRAVMEVAGIQNVLTKSLGTSNPHNVIKATFDALLHLKDAAEGGGIARTRSGGSGRLPKPPRIEHGYDKENVRNVENQVGAQLYWLPARHAPDDSRPGLPPHAAGGGAPGHAGHPRHDRESASSWWKWKD